MDPEVLSAALQGDFGPFTAKIKEECKGGVGVLVERVKKEQREMIGGRIEGVRAVRAEELISVRRDGDEFVGRSEYGFSVFVQAVVQGASETRSVWSGFISTLSGPSATRI